MYQPSSGDAAPVKAAHKVFGWAGKQGGSYKSWKNRFFVLDEGLLKYYTDGDLENGDVQEKNMKGFIDLSRHKWAEGNGPETSSLHITLVPLTEGDKDAREFLMEFKSIPIRQDWGEAIDLHLKAAASSVAVVASAEV